MADATPTTSKTSVSRIPIRSASTCKSASYNKSIRLCDLKYRGPPTSDTSSSASTRSPTLTPPTSDTASSNSPNTIARNLNGLKTYHLGTSTSGPAVSQPTPQPTNSHASAAHIPQPAQLNPRPSIPPPFPQIPVVETPKRPKTSHDTYTPPSPLLQQTHSLLHTHLETLMQALYLRIQTAPHLSPSLVQAFEELAADTLYSGMGERIHAHALHRRVGQGDKRSDFVAGLEAYLRREAARNERRYYRGMNFREECGGQSEGTEERGSCV